MAMIDALTVAGSGLANVNRALAVVSNNIANAQTPGYLREVSTQTSLASGGMAMGVATGLTTRDVDTALQARLLTQNAAVGGASTSAALLAPIDAAHGAPGSGGDLAALVGALGNTFSALANDPSSAPQQRAVVDQAGTLATQINTLAQTVGTQRQAAQDTIVAGVTALNADLARIGALNKQIAQLQSEGNSTADLENQRDAAAQDASANIDLKFMVRPNGAMAVFTTSGLELPTDPASPKLSVASAVVGPGAFYPGGGLPGVMLGGIDVTAQLSTGKLGAAVTMRDKTLPTYQGELDEFAETLSNRFADQGLTLFTDGSGTIPVTAGPGPRQAGYIGYANRIQVNPAVDTTPSLVRDGTTAIAGTPGGASAFTPNPAGGPAGFSDMITRVLNYSLGSQIAPGVSQTAPSLLGMGATGSLNSGIATPVQLGDFASTLVANQTTQAADAQTAATAAGNIQTALQQSLAQSSGVNMDTEMSTMVTLQQAYSANAKVISANQAMWSQLLAAVQ